MPDGGAADTPGRRHEPHPPLPGLLHKVIEASSRWLAAEVAQGRTDLRTAAGNVLKGILVMLVAIAFLLAGVVLLVEAAALAASQYLGSVVGGHAMTGAACVLAAAGLAVIATRTMKAMPRFNSRAVKWLLGNRRSLRD
jgi:hypothetical protein